MISKTKLNQLKGYSQKKVRAETGCFWVKGWRSLEEACKASVSFEIVLVTEGLEEGSSFRGKSWEMICTRAKEVLEVTESEMKKITSNTTPPGISALVSWTPEKFEMSFGSLKGRQQLIVAVDRISEPGNLGTIIRTCDWFGVDGLLVGSGSVELTNPKVVRSTMGSLFHFPIFTEVDLQESVRDLKGSGFTAYGAALGENRCLYDTVWANKALLVIGSEAWGIDSDLFSELEGIRIPGYGKSESLNAGVATGVFLSTIRQSFSVR
ncbi:MAG: RNA methyltransferase [Opitutaceae bacterium]|nr:RNA methyltransferase [Opitutaceae bacterium]